MLARAPRAPGLIRWSRVIYLTLLIVALVTVPMSVLNVRVQSPGRLVLTDPQLFVVVAGLAFLTFLLLEYLQILGEVPVVRELYLGRGLLRLDILGIILAVIGLWQAWQQGWLHPSLIALGAILIVNGLLGLWQYRNRYVEFITEELPSAWQIEAGQALEAGARAAPLDDQEETGGETNDHILRRIHRYDL